MKSRIVSFGILFLMAAMVALVSAGAARTQTVRGPAEAPATIPVGAVGERSPSVDLKSVGREVAPGVLEVNPEAVRGKRIKLTPGSQNAAKHACIGRWDGKSCKGIYIEW